METLKLAGVKVNNITKLEMISEVKRLIDKKVSSYVVTPYSEFFLKAQNDNEFKKVLNNANLSLADGVGVLMGLKYLNMKGSPYIDLLRCILSSIINPDSLNDVVKEKLSGSAIIYDICELAQKGKYKIFFLGGFDFGNGNTGELARNKLIKLYPKLRVCGTYAGNPSEQNETEIVKIINKNNPDILFIAYGPVKQEKWAWRNKDKLVPMISFCLGGTFDFVAGEKRKVPKVLAERGFEGILRPFVSERGNAKLMFSRFKRVFTVVPRFIFKLIEERKLNQDK